MIENLSPSTGRLLKRTVLIRKSVFNPYSCLTIRLDSSDGQVVRPEDRSGFPWTFEQVELRVENRKETWVMPDVRSIKIRECELDCLLRGSQEVHTEDDLRSAPATPKRAEACLQASKSGLF